MLGLALLGDLSLPGVLSLASRLAASSARSVLRYGPELRMTRRNWRCVAACKELRAKCTETGPMSV